MVEFCRLLFVKLFFHQLFLLSCLYLFSEFQNFHLSFSFERHFGISEFLFESRDGDDGKVLDPLLNQFRKMAAVVFLFY